MSQQRQLLVEAKGNNKKASASASSDMVDEGKSSGVEEEGGIFGEDDEDDVTEEFDLDDVSINLAPMDDDADDTTPRVRICISVAVLQFSFLLLMPSSLMLIFLRLFLNL